MKKYNSKNAKHLTRNCKSCVLNSNLMEGIEVIGDQVVGLIGMGLHKMWPSICRHEAADAKL